MNKFTKGPWAVGYGDGICGPRVGPACYLDDCDCRQIPIRVGREAVAWILCDDEDTEADADARLIASAPDMYEALELALMGINVAAEEGGEAFIGFVFTADKISSVLAKARGETDE